MRATWLPMLAVLLCPVPGRAQDAAPPAPAQGAAAEDAAADVTGLDAAPAGAFVYDPQGRRDPFVSLIARGAGLTSAPEEPAVGVAALTVDEVALRGVLRTPQGYVALVEGADARTYVVRPGDRLRDGTVERIADEDMVIRQQINDPLSLESEREVRKTLRQTEEAVP